MLRLERIDFISDGNNGTIREYLKKQGWQELGDEDSGVFCKEILGNHCMATYDEKSAIFKFYITKGEKNLTKELVCLILDSFGVK